MAKKTPPHPSDRLLAVIDAADVRFALQSPGGRPHHQVVVRSEESRSLRAAVQRYLDRVGTHPRSAAFGVAAHVTDGRVDMPSSLWSFSVDQIRRAFRFRRLEVVNDAAAIALSIPLLSPQDWRKIGRGKRAPDRPCVVLVIGRRLGTSCLIPTTAGPLPLETEGGHVTLAPFSDFEAGVLGFLRPKFDHISAERVLSGPGLVNLYMAVAPIEGRQPLRLTPSTIIQRAATDECQVCIDVIDMFSDMLGTVASNLALSTGAAGGVYLAGDILTDMGDTFNGRRFRRRFEDKGRLSEYLAAIPTYAITHPWHAFLGLAHLLDTESIH